MSPRLSRRGASSTVRRRNDADFEPQPFRREPPFVECLSEDVLDDHQAAIRREHDPIGGERAVCDVFSLRVKISERGRQLANQPRRKPRVHAVVVMGAAKHVGQPFAFDVRRNQRQAVVAFEASDRSRLRECGVLERCQTLDRLAQCALESRCIRQRWTESEQLERSRARVVEHQQTIAETVRDSLRVPTRDRRLRGRGPARGIGEKIVSAAVHSSRR